MLAIWTTRAGSSSGTSTVMAAALLALVLPAAAVSGSDAEPLAMQWSRGPPLPVPYVSTTATALPNGRVLLAGGSTPQTSRRNANTYLFNPLTGNQSTAWSSHEEFPYTLLMNGGIFQFTTSSPTTVLAVGTLFGTDGNNGFQSTIDISTVTWGSVITTNDVARIGGFSLITLPNGSTVIFGGTPPGHLDTPTSMLSSAAIQTPNTSTWTPIAEMPASRAYGRAAALQDGR
jgi:hypothetical protein